MLRVASVGVHARLLLSVAVISVSMSGASATPVAAAPALVTQGLSFTADDGVVLHATIGGVGAVTRRPLIIEDSPYAPACCDSFAGPAYNYIELQWRGTGQSDGAFSTTGARDQKDLSEFVAWSCSQPWSDGRIGLYGFSASAIAVYNTMHLALPCVRAAALMSGTVDLYRDLLYIGGINNSVPGSVVEGQIIGSWAPSLPGRVHDRPATIPGGVTGYATAPRDVQAHATEDAYWAERAFTGDLGHIPVLADDGFYDVESRGAFQAYAATRQYGSHLLVIGAHDGFAGGTPGPFPEYARWFDHYVRGIDNGIDREPAVNAYLSDGSHKELIDGHYTRLSGAAWPLPGTRWTRLYLSSAVSRTAHSINDGSLSLTPASPAVQTYPFAPSDSLETDVHTTSTISGAGGGGVSLDDAAQTVPALTDMQIAEPMSLTYTTAPFANAVDAVGPAGLDVFASSTAPVTDLVAVLADVWPDGTAHAVATGQLRTAYPRVDAARSLIDPSTGEIVQPYTDFSSQDPAAPGTTREYHLEILPIGNHFAAGHRLRVYVVGTSAAMQSALPGVNSLSIGGATRSRLLLPTIDAAPTASAGVASAGTAGVDAVGRLPVTSPGGGGAAELSASLLIGCALRASARRVRRPRFAHSDRRHHMA